MFIYSLMKVQMVAERVPFLGCFEVCGPLLPVVLPSHQKEFLMFLNVHILVLEPWGIRSYTLSHMRRQSWRCCHTKQVGATYLSFLLLLTLYIYVDVGDKSTASKMLDDHLKTILENVRLVYLLEREDWDATPNWEDILSLGEQQRLGMVSVIKTYIILSCIYYWLKQMNISSFVLVLSGRNCFVFRLVCSFTVLNMASSTNAPSMS